MLFELATGKPPFYTTNLKTLIQLIQESDVPQIPAFSSEFNDFVQLLLTKDPLQRPTWVELKAHPVWKDKNCEFAKHTIYPD
jgi:serine/threonine protein kinase